MSALPTKLEQYRQQLLEAPGPESARQIISEYFSFFGKDTPGQELWLLTEAALIGEEVDQASTAKGRHDMLFFYEFTKMLLDAVYCLHKERLQTS